jgi:hypothetical protein
MKIGSTLLLVFAAFLLLLLQALFDLRQRTQVVKGWFSTLP